jgi:transposase
MKYLEGFNRGQSVLFPVCIDEMIPDDAEVRMIDLFVDSLPLKELGFLENTPTEEGRPMYHPRDLFKLYVYGYLNRIRTSRLLERECTRNIELIWLLKGLRPCFRTIAGFRSTNPELFRNTFKHFVNKLNKSNFFGKKTVAIDSSKFRAVNSKKNNFNQRKIDRQINYIENKVNEYVKELDNEDLSDNKRATIENKINKQRQNKRKYRRIEKQLQESGLDQISTTDPEARTMILHGSVIEVAYNTQTIADDKHNLIVDYQVTNSNDRKALHPMSLKAKASLNVKELTVLADKGYHNGEQLAACEKDHIKSFVSPPEIPRSSDIPTPEFYGENFMFNSKTNTYTCPEGHQMTTTNKWYHKKYEKSVTRVKHYTTGKCVNCEMRQWCTKNPKGRVIERSEYAGAVERNNKRVKKNTETYSKRQQIIEHVFGTIKRQWGFDHILLKGITKNDGEFGLIYLIYNFRRVMNILGVKKLKSWLKTIFFVTLSNRVSHRAYCKLKIYSVLNMLLTTVNDIRNFKLSYCTN